MARLATAGPDGQPHQVPIVFAVSRDRIWSAIDWKPKSSRGLRRLDNIRANPRVSLLVDFYDDADWSALWWVRVDGTARLRDAADAPEALAALAQKYAQYRETPPPGPVIEIAVARWLGWAASG